MVRAMDGQPGRSNLNNFSKPLRSRAELRVPEKAPDVKGGVAWLYVEVNNAITRVRQLSVPEIEIVRKKGGLFQAMQNGNDV